MLSVTEITFHPPFPVPAIVGLGLLVLLLVIAAYYRTARQPRRMTTLALAFLRTLAVAGLVCLLLRPMRAEPLAHEGEKPILAIAVDTSASMKTADVKGVSRADAVRAAMEKTRRTFERDLASTHDVRFYSFSNSAHPVEFGALLKGATPAGLTTDLTAALLQTTTIPPTRSLAGVVLITDGRDNAGGDVRRAATFVKGANAGVWTVPVGTDAHSQDVYITARLKQNYLFVNQTGTITANISQSGFANQYVDVSLLRDDILAGTERVALTDRSATIEFPVNESRKGVFKYALQVTPLPGEIDTNNNKRTVFVRAVDQRTKVLLLEARPYWDSKFLLRALQRDPNLEVTSLFQINEEKAVGIAEGPDKDPLDKPDRLQGVALPKTKEDLYKFDCLILGKGIDSLLSSEQLALIRDYVKERGGGVVFSRARAYGFDNAALAALEPLVWERDSVHGKRFELTPEGKASPAFAFGTALPSDTVIRELPEMVSVTKVAQEKSLSVVLARSKQDEGGREIATIAYQRYGKGKVMSVGATGLWRWAIMPKELSEYDDIYATFWGQMLRWLVSESEFLPGQEVSFRTDRYTYDLDESVQLNLRTKFVDTQSLKPVAIIKTPAGRQISIALEPDPQSPGSYSARFQPEEEGEFLATLREDPIIQGTQETAPFTVYSDKVETRLVSADLPLLSELSALTGAETVPLDLLDTLPAKLTAFERQTATRSKLADAWDRLGVFVALLALVSAEWFIRRRIGMV